MHKRIAIPAIVGVTAAALLATSEPAAAHGGGSYGDMFEGTDAFFWTIVGIILVIIAAVAIPKVVRTNRIEEENNAKRLSKSIADLHARYVSIIGAPGDESPIVLKIRQLTDHNDGPQIVKLLEMLNEFKGLRRALDNLPLTIIDDPSRTRVPYHHGDFSKVQWANHCLSKIEKLIVQIEDFLEETSRQYQPHDVVDTSPDVVS
jgi:hypothetical protein